MIMVNRTSACVFIAMLVLVWVLIFFNAFSNIRANISDRLHGEDEPLNNIVIVRIDDESINSVGEWPWPRNVYAELLNNVKDAKIVGVDISFFEKSEDDLFLNRTISEMKNIVLASEVNEGKLYRPIFDAKTGYVNLFTSIDGVTRSIKTGLSNEEMPFSFLIYEEVWGDRREYSAGEFNIRFVNKPGSFDSVSAYDLLSNRSRMNFTGKIVLIGATAPNLHDSYFVPTSYGRAMPGVEIHANVIQNLMLNSFLKKQDRFSLILAASLLGFLFFFIFSKLRIYYTILVILLFIVSHILITIILFDKFNYILDVFFMPLSIIVFAGAGIGINYLEERKQNRFITDAFSKYMSPDLVNEILSKRQELKLVGTKREITIFFSDIRGFTSISEMLTPEELVSLINKYLTEMTEIIMKHKGTVDKFIGDAIMAIWNAPLLDSSHAKNACCSALEQIKRLAELKDKLASENLPEIKIGCGINTGEAIIGNMGSENRFDYTALGDSVNLASRLESLTKHYGVNIILSEFTYEKLRGDRKFSFRKLDRVRVKGKKVPINLYELCVDNSKRNLVYNKCFERAFDLYLSMRFKEAEKKFRELLKRNPWKKDKACELFIERCVEYGKHSPGKDWDGSFEMKNK
jgi:adenylate cyclase